MTSQRTSRILTPVLTGKAQQANHTLPLVNAEDYNTLKEEILAHCGLYPTRATAKFHWSYQPDQEPKTQMDGLLRITQRWLQPDQLTPTEIVDQVTLDHFLWDLSGEERRAVGIKAAQMPRDMGTALECALATLEMGRGRKGLHSSVNPTITSAQASSHLGGHRMTPCHNLHLRMSQYPQSQNNGLQPDSSSPGWWGVPFTLPPSHQCHHHT